MTGATYITRLIAPSVNLVILGMLSTIKREGLVLKLGPLQLKQKERSNMKIFEPIYYLWLYLKVNTSTHHLIHHLNHRQNHQYFR